MQKIRIDVCFQNMSATRKGSPVCPEKNRSPVNIKFCRKSDNETMVWVGNGPIWVRLIEMERINTKSEILLTIKGAFPGCQKHKKVIYIINNRAPYVKIPSTSYARVLLNMMSVTGLLMECVAYSPAKKFQIKAIHNNIKPMERLFQ